MVVGHKHFGKVALASWSLALVLVACTFMAREQSKRTTELYSPNETLNAEEEFMTLHPVYTRCSKKADMAAFSKLVLVKCGDVHELSSCSWECTSALQSYANNVGCCWESVMEGYEALDAEAAQAWRLWQGAASGKCGVTFESESCGDAMGEKKYTELENDVTRLAAEAESNAETINGLVGVLSGYASQGYGGFGTMFKDSDKIGDVKVDDKIDIPGKGNGDQQIPVDKLQPEYYSRGHKQNAHKTAFPSMKAARTTELYNAFDDFRNYQNGLRLKEGYDARFKPLKAAGVQPSEVDGTLGGYSIPGHSWQD